jgi:hypothetical protein
VNAGTIIERPYISGSDDVIAVIATQLSARRHRCSSAMTHDKVCVEPKRSIDNYLHGASVRMIWSGLVLYLALRSAEDSW